MPRRFAPLLLLVLSVPCGPAMAETYGNARFGYTVSYPGALLRPQREAPNGDGRVFVSRAGHARFTVYAASRQPDETPDSIAADAAEPCGASIPTYRVVKPDVVAMSCLSRDTIYYAKTLLTADARTTLTGAYLADERDRWDAVIRQMAASLSPATR